MNEVVSGEKLKLQKTQNSNKRFYRYLEMLRHHNTFFSSACMSRASGVDTITKHIGKSHFVLYVLRIETSNIYSLHLRFRKSHICWKRLWYPKHWTIPEFTQNISYNWRAFLNPHCGENLVGVLMLQVNTSVLHSFEWKGSKERDVENSEKLH